MASKINEEKTLKEKVIKSANLTAECSGLTAKQRAALRANDSLDWTCRECAEASPRRKSVVVPDEDDDEEIESVPQVSASHVAGPIDGKKLLRDINSLLEKAMKRELTAITQALDFNSDKMDEMLEGMDALKATIQDLKKKNIELTNKCNNLETRVGAMEQRMQELEQEKLCKTIEVYNLPGGEKIDAAVVVNTIADKLEVSGSDVDDIKYFPGTKDRAGRLQVVLAKESVQNQWLLKAKTARVTVGDIVHSAPEAKAKEPVFISEALTPFNKALLRSARKQLKETALFKFVWCKRGVIRARRGEDQPSTVIRTELDIKRLLSK